MFATRVSIRWTRVLCGSPGQRGLPALELVERAQTEAVKLRLREQTETAKCKGILGAPTFFVRGEMFWGNDRLEDALAFAVESSAGA